MSPRPPSAKAPGSPVNSRGLAPSGANCPPPAGERNDERHDAERTRQGDQRPSRQRLLTEPVIGRRVGAARYKPSIAPSLGMKFSHTEARPSPGMR